MGAPHNTGSGVIVAQGILKLPAGASQTAHVITCGRCNVDCVITLQVIGATAGALAALRVAAGAGIFTINHTSADPGATGTLFYTVIDAAENP